MVCLFKGCSIFNLSNIKRDLVPTLHCSLLRRVIKSTGVVCDGLQVTPCNSSCLVFMVSVQKFLVAADNLLRSLFMHRPVNEDPHVYLPFLGQGHHVELFQSSLCRGPTPCTDQGPRSKVPGLLKFLCVFLRSPVPDDVAIAEVRTY